MDNFLTKNALYVHPGYGYLQIRDSVLYTVVGSGIAIIIFDIHKKMGGMCHFIKPCDENITKTDPYYSIPSILGLLRLFYKRGSLKCDLETHIYGGAEDPAAPNYEPGLAVNNIKNAVSILKSNGYKIISQDVGGNKGRKIIFNTHTGEIIIAKVNNIRKSDWYPLIGK